MQLLGKTFQPALFIDGEFRDSLSGDTIDVLNPATGASITSVPAANADDVNAAVFAARRQFEQGEWSGMSGAQRGQLLYRLADLIERDADFLAQLESIDNGKLASAARQVDLENTIATFRYFAGWADKIEGRTIPTPQLQGRHAFSYTVREPLGVIGAISAYNCPTMYVAWKAAPALAAGNTVVLKAPEDAPLTSLYFGHLFLEAGFPPGVINILTGLGPVAGTALVQHPGVAKVSFTGGGVAGRAIARAAADLLKPVTLELGGKAPQIILEDADLPTALGTVALGIFANQGQICAAGTRILVHRSLQDVVIKGLVALAKDQRVGNPLDASNTMGPMTTAAASRRVLEYVEKGRDEGATLHTGGKALPGAGYFVEPTIFSGTNDHVIAREEIFGPVGTIIPFDTHDEAIHIANDTAYGLNAGVFTKSVSYANQMASQLRTGAVWINGWGLVDPRLPWGGIKASGYGRENGFNGIEDVTHEKLVTTLL